MTKRLMCSSIAAGLLAGGVLVVGVANGHAQDATVLPEHGGSITLVGCLAQAGKHNKLMLARPTTAAVASVPEATCSTNVGDTLVELKDTHKRHLDDSFVGRWIEVSGRLEGYENDREPRELHVKGFKEVPVVIPAAPAPPPAPAPAPAPPITTAPIPEEKPAATTGVVIVQEQPKKLPKTASPLPLMELSTGLLLAGAFGVRLFRLRSADRG
jgi:hypothetical protein